MSFEKTPWAHLSIVNNSPFTARFWCTLWFISVWDGFIAIAQQSLSIEIVLLRCYASRKMKREESSEDYLMAIHRKLSAWNWMSVRFVFLALQILIAQQKRVLFQATSKINEQWTAIIILIMRTCDGLRPLRSTKLFKPRDRYDVRCQKWKWNDMNWALDRCHRSLRHKTNNLCFDWDGNQRSLKQFQLFSSIEKSFTRVSRTALNENFL